MTVINLLTKKLEIYTKNIGQGIAHSCRLIDQQNCSNEKFNEFLIKKTSVWMLKPKIFWSLCRFLWNDNACRAHYLTKYLAASIFNNNNIVPLPKF